jgi:ADP-ribose pyrophosphatase
MELISKHLILDRSPFLKVWNEEVRLPDGRIIPDWTRLETPPYALITAVTVDDTIPLVRNYKHGSRCMMINLPGGYFRSGEDPLAAAQRELLEETGLVSDHWTALGGYVVNANREAGWGHFFLAREARQVTTPDDGDLETLEIRYYSLPEFRAVWRSTEMVQASSTAAIGLALAELGQL